MPDVNPCLRLLYSAVLSLLCLTSCNTQVKEIPFPVSDSGFPQPVTEKLQFGPARKISFTPSAKGPLQPHLKSLDLDALPSVSYDSGGFKAYPKPPTVVHFDTSKMETIPYDVSKVQPLPLHFKTYILPTPSLIKAGALIPKTNISISVSDIWMAQGLQVRNVFACIEDSQGFIWLGTDKGIYRYDGEYFRAYDKVGNVLGLMEDRQHNIWYINDTIIGVLNPLLGTVRVSSEIHTRYPGLPKMIQDSAGLIWVPRSGKSKINLIDPTKDSYRVLAPPDSSTSWGAWQVNEDQKRNLWISSLSGVYILNPERTSLRRIDRQLVAESDSSSANVIDKQGRAWFSWRSGDLGLIDLAAGTVTNYPYNLSPAEAVYSYRLALDSNGRVWDATSRGLQVIDPAKNSFRIFNGNELAAARDFVLDVVPDRHQRMWTASNSFGVSVFDQNGEMTHPVSVAKQMSTLMEDMRGRIWIGAGNAADGIQIIDREKKRSYRLTKQDGIANNFIQNITEDSGSIYISDNGGFEIINKAGKTIQHLGREDGITDDTLYSVIKDKKGNTWFTGPANGLDRLDAVTKTFSHAGEKEGLSEKNLDDVREDADGRIWVANYSRGVDVIDLEKGTIQNLSQGAGLAGVNYKSLMPDKQGRMWIGTGKGLVVADLRAGTFTNITTKEGLTDNAITSVLPYQDKVLAGALKGVSIITPPTGQGLWRVNVMQGTENLVNVNNNWNTNVVTKNNEYLWGDLGVTTIYGIRPSEDEIPVGITGLSIMNVKRDFTNPLRMTARDTVRTLDTFYLGDKITYTSVPEGETKLKWDSVAGPYNMPVNLKIPYNENYLQFEFAQQHLGTVQTPSYSYILEGIDKNWSNFSSRTETDNYLNLPAGNYIFKVRSRGPGGHWSRPATMTFTILPPWWKTWWMYCIYTLIVLGAILGYNKYRSTSLIRKNAELEARVQARTMEVNQQAGELRTINQISQALVSQVDLTELINLVGNQLKDLFKANIVYVALLDKKTKIIHFPYQHGDNMQPLKLGEGLTSKIIVTGEPLLVNKDVKELTAGYGIDHVGIPAASYLGVPIPVAEEIIGVLSIQSTEKENHFAEKDKNLLTTIAANVGVAIRKARLFEEVKAANLDADAARKAAEEANAAKSAFLSTVSHELRTPLTSVLGFTRITKKSLEEKVFPFTDKSDPKTARAITQISGNLGVVIAEGERLTNLINDVLDLAKIEAGKMEWNLEPVNMSDIIDRAIAATSALFQQKNLQLDKEIEDRLPEVNADRDKMIQVVVNLLSNAVKFTDSGAVTCKAFFKDGAVIVGITDTGIGIAPADHAKVFEQFKQVGDTLTDKPKGTGLGLPICKEIVEHHDGKIWLESELGNGSTFYFMVPAIAATEKVNDHMHFNDLLRQLKKRVEQTSPALQTKTGSNILVVDDDDGIRSLLKQELSEAGYHVDEAANGKEALARIRAKRPDLILLDVMMPEMNGFDVAAIVKNDPATMEIPIIILSIVQDKSRGFRIGVDRYLTKPIDTALLFSEIGHLLEQGKSRKKVLVVDEDAITVRTLSDALEARGYQVTESDGRELMEKAVSTQPDIIILNSAFSDRQEIVKSLRFEKGLEDVLFLIYQ